MTYMWKGKQYVVIAAGGHEKLGTKHGDQLIAFASAGLPIETGRHLKLATPSLSTLNDCFGDSRSSPWSLSKG